ncbi:MAG: MBL fold metallo-hydrolase [Candidatus Gottesmanbacteria bacterium]|nr:MBL fold metallo-hydrolase [Candidatus Gottesmanbacteria bacterium]
MTIETLVVGQMATNCYIVDGLIIDPGDDAEYIISHLQTKPTMIIATHGHFDHIMAAYALQLAYNIPFVMHEADAFLLETMRGSAKHFLHIAADPPPNINRFIKDGDKFAGLTVMHTPGHTPGSICLYSKKNNVLFSGDTIFADGAVGRTDNKYSDKAALSRSIATILSLPSNTVLFPGHGETSNVKRERPYHAVVQ